MGLECDTKMRNQHERQPRQRDTTAQCSRLGHQWHVSQPPGKKKKESVLRVHANRGMRERGPRKDGKLPSQPRGCEPQRCSRRARFPVRVEPGRGRPARNGQRSRTGTVTDAGRPIVCGFGWCGQLELGNEGNRTTHTLEERALFNGDAVLMVACGASHAAAVTEGGASTNFGRARCPAAGARAFAEPACAEAGASGRVQRRAGRNGGRDRCAHKMALSEVGHSYTWLRRVWAAGTQRSGRPEDAAEGGGQAIRGRELRGLGGRASPHGGCDDGRAAAHLGTGFLLGDWATTRMLPGMCLSGWGQWSLAVRGSRRPRLEAHTRR